MNTGVGFDKLVPMLHLHYLTKILTSIGLDREAVGVQLECRADVLKKMMFMIQDHVRKLLQKGLVNLERTSAKNYLLTAPGTPAAVGTPRPRRSLDSASTGPSTCPARS